EVALLSDCFILDSLQAMRKMVVDGSNTSGFQRTVLLAVNGSLKTKSNKVIRIQSIAVEEDSGRTISQDDESITYRIDRLGIPLIELATFPDIRTPEEAKEFALRIGELFRVGCKAKRGLGSIRQDLNISIKDGARIEIKGIQELDLIDEFVRREVQRQLALLEVKKELIERKISKESFFREIASLGKVFARSESKLFKGNEVYGVKLTGFNGLLGKEVQPNRRFGSEIASYVKQRVGLKGLIHSDEDLTKYKAGIQEIQEIKKVLGIEERDAFVLLIAGYEAAKAGFDVIKERCLQAFDGIPEETRNPLADGNSEYSRPLPGPARMYPETDIPAIELSREKLAGLKAKLPLWPEQRLESYQQKGLPKQLAEKMILDNFARFFESLLDEGFNPTLAAKFLLEDLVTLKRGKHPVENLSNEMIKELLMAAQDGKITKEVLLEVAGYWSGNPEMPLIEVIKKFVGEQAGNEAIRKEIDAVLEANSELIKEKGLQALSALMGEAMARLKGRASGKEISSMLKQKLDEKVKGIIFKDSKA
ncbi:Glu-tRNA(Gln) amidotransferase subunit GatE, partial [archaeon]|nr:Glu-tRNA(Gln) amidotransferase subunit GatE [archaeon]